MQNNMPVLRFTLRFLSLLMYVLPFVFFVSTCTSPLTSKEAFTKKEALAQEQERRAQNLSELHGLLDSIDRIQDSALKASLRGEILQTFRHSGTRIEPQQDFWFRLIRPTNDSLSAIGAIWFHKNLVGKISIAVSLLLSMLLLLFHRFLQQKNLVLKLMVANLIVLIFFMVNNLLCEVSTLYGAWLLLFLIVMHILIEKQQRQGAES